MRTTPFGQKWVVKYHCRDGQLGMGLAQHYQCLAQMIEILMAAGAYNIVIFDKTFYKDEEHDEEGRPGKYEILGGR